MDANNIFKGALKLLFHEKFTELLDPRDPGNPFQKPSKRWDQDKGLKLWLCSLMVGRCLQAKVHP